ncbi:hypothetical protein DEH84_16280 [Aquabacterium olei]|uniref:Phospholipase D-like domain-containing protein n=1 Tax=Aquabacterium olei TaxID=1296669 RepID=A0A2U8FUQ2_9BURK|nr:hypothetical protein DEH84_16280 [Aquabacterium olei]
MLTRCDLKSARAGQVSGKDLLAWHKRGVRIFTLQSLHAKVFAFSGAALIGSSNASETSRDRLLEAGVWSTDKAMAAAAWQFVETHCLEEVDEHFLAELAEAYRPPTTYPLQGEPRPGQAAADKPKTSEREQDEAPLHLLRLYTATYSAAQESASEKAEAQGRARVNASVRAEINTFVWPGARCRFQVGDLVLARSTDRKAAEETVEPWARVVATRKVRGKDEHVIATATIKSWDEMPLDEFRAAMDGLLDNFLGEGGGRSRMANAEERRAILAVWRHRKARLI